MRRAALTVLLAGLGMAPGNLALAVERTTADVIGLARQAGDDPAAVDQLRMTTTVDGRKVDLKAALATDKGSEIRSRISTLAAAAGEVDLDTERIDREVRRILSQAAFQRESSDSPWGVWTERQVFRFLAWLDRLISALPGGAALFWALLAGVVVGLTLWVTLRLGRRRNREVEARQAAARQAERGFDPDALERLAKKAVVDRDFAEAVRLRFLAGLLRLDQRAMIEWRPGLTSAEVAGALSDSEFDRLWDDFDQIVYGDRPAGAADAEAAESGWRRLVHNR